MPINDTGAHAHTTAQDAITKAIATYDRAGLVGRLAQAEKQRADIVERFPLDGWPTLTLERYALGQKNSEDTYCRWLEFRSNDLGSMSGGSAMKMVIFKRKDQDGWYYPEQHFTSLETAWETLRSSFVEAFRLAKEGEWESIDSLPALEYGPALKVKSLHVYFPAEVLPIYSRDALQHFLRALGESDAETRNIERVVLNRRLLARLRAIPELNGWSTNEIAFFLYDILNPREVRRVVKIAPGENAKYWPECLQGGFICLGWGEVGDLNVFENKSAFKVEFEKKYGAIYNNSKSKISAKANELWTLMELEPGDIIVANQGTSKVLAVGEVMEPGYEWRPDRAEFWHTVRVKWDTAVAQTIEPQLGWATVTVGKVAPALYEAIVRGQPNVQGGGQPIALATNQPLDPELAGLMDTLERKGQLILYGPPGTGKTYTARKLSVAFQLRHEGKEIASVLADDAKLAAAEAAMSQATSSRRVWWVVANPAEWRWETLFKTGTETFREGRLKRNYAQLQAGDLVIGYSSTPDKRIMALAKVSQPAKRGVDGELRFEIQPLTRVTNGPTYEDLLKEPALAGSEPIRFNNQGTLFSLTAAEVEHLLGMMLARDTSLEAYLPDETSGVPPIVRLTFHPSYSYEDFIEGFRPYQGRDDALALRLEDGVFKRVCGAARANPERRYVVLIDEINRANIGKVFGEVITLIERDKRNLLITLPQSKQTFSIPPNVFIIGTMNTADRSIKLLDAALRRRFAFAEVMPNSETLQGAKVGTMALDEFLDELNRRISREAGREKQIGHSFLLEGGKPVSDPTEFARRFRQEILPLLQEYCYEDYATLALYIGDEIVDADDGALDMDRIQDPESLIAALQKAFAAPAAKLD